MKTVRQIDVFEKDKDALFEELPLTAVDLPGWKQKFDVPADDPDMYNAYRITFENASLFPDITFDFERFEYYLTCFSR